MTATLGIIGYGTLFQTGDTASPINWTTLAEVSGVYLPPLSVDVIDAGHEAMPGEWREILTGLRTAGEVSVQLNFYKTTLQTLYNQLNAMTLLPRRIVFPGGSSLQFNAYLISIEQPIAVGGLLQTVAKLRPSGAPGPLTIV